MSSSGASGALPKGHVLDDPNREQQESVNNPSAGPSTSHPDVRPCFFCLPFPHACSDVCPLRFFSLSPSTFSHAYQPLLVPLKLCRLSPYARRTQYPLATPVHSCSPRRTQHVTPLSPLCSLPCALCRR